MAGEQVRKDEEALHEPSNLPLPLSPMGEVKTAPGIFVFY